MSTDLQARYGTAPAWRRPVLRGVLAVLAAVFLAWLAWAAWHSSTPEIDSGLTSYDVVDAHRTTAVLTVDVDGDVEEATCRVRALAGDHSVVGEVGFTPVDGRNEVTIRTERLATSVEALGCTTPDQRRPR